MADPGLWSINSPLRGIARKLGMSEAEADRIVHGDSAIANRFGALIVGQSARTYWSIVKRAFWVHGVSDFAAYLAAISAFRLNGRADTIRCPVLLTEAEEDGLSRTAGQVLDALTC